MKITGAVLIHSVIFEGVGVSFGGDSTINNSKHPGVEFEIKGPLLLVTLKTKTMGIPLSNVKKLNIERD